MDERIRKRIDDTAENVGRAANEQARQIALKALERRRTMQRERRRRQALETIGVKMEVLLDKDNRLVAASNELFGNPENAVKAILIQDGENRPGKGETEVERVYADSSLIPLGYSKHDQEYFGVLRLWGIFRGGDRGGETIYTPRLYFGENRKKRNFFDVFDFDSYDITYVAGSSLRPSDTNEEPIGTDLNGRKIWGTRVTTKPDGNPGKVDDVLRLSTIYSIEKIWIITILKRLRNNEVPETERTQRLNWLRKSLERYSAQQDSYEQELDNLLLAASKTKIVKNTVPKK